MMTDVGARSTGETKAGYLEDLHLFQDSSNRFKPCTPQQFLAFLIPTSLPFNTYNMTVPFPVTQRKNFPDPSKQPHIS